MTKTNRRLIVVASYKGKTGIRPNSKRNKAESTKTIPYVS